jgi:hypothetical protein
MKTAGCPQATRRRARPASPCPAPACPALRTGLEERQGHSENGADRGGPLRQVAELKLVHAGLRSLDHRRLKPPDLPPQTHQRLDHRRTVFRRSRSTIAACADTPTARHPPSARRRRRAPGGGAGAGPSSARRSASPTAAVGPALLVAVACNNPKECGCHQSHGFVDVSPGENDPPSRQRSLAQLDRRVVDQFGLGSCGSKCLLQPSVWRPGWSLAAALSRVVAPRTPPNAAAGRDDGCRDGRWVARCAVTRVSCEDRCWQRSPSSKTRPGRGQSTCCRS